MLAAIEQRKECVDIILPPSVENVIQQCLNHFDYENAAVLAEVLYAKERSASALLLYAQCLMQWGKIQDTYELLKSQSYERCGMTRLTFAQCAFILRKLEEAASALRRENSSYLNIQVHESFDETSQPFAHKLLAQVYTEIGLPEQGKAHYCLSLVGNPLLFNTMRQFGQLGGDSVTKLFSAITDENEARPVKALRRYAERYSRTRTRILELPHTSTQEAASPASPVHIRPSASPPVKKRRTLTSLSQPTRQSVSPPSSVNEMALNADRAVVEFMLQLSEAVHALSFYRCEEAVQILNQTAMVFQQVSVTLRLRGILLFELRDHSKCSEVLLELRRLFPYRTEGMEILSTALWQLQNQHQLSALATDLLSANRDDAITWCVVGNLFSLENNPEAAVTAFERAVKIDSRFGYAYSLLGHELIALNKLNRALKVFKKAKIYSPIAYSALYGEGLVHAKIEKSELSLAFFKKAVEVNPRNVILLCQLAVVEHSLERSADAIDHLRQALEIEPNSIPSRFYKARIHFDQAQYKEAEKELNELKNLCPNEAHVFYLLGRVQRRLGDKHRAMLSFSLAAEIDPKGEQSRPALSDDGTCEDDGVAQKDADRT